MNMANFEKTQQMICEVKQKTLPSAKLLRIALTVLLWAMFLGGCNKVAVMTDDRVLLGGFYHEQIHYCGAEYNKTRGVGFSFGTIGLGFGYYDLQYLNVDKDVAVYLHAPIADVLVMKNTD